MGFFLGIKKSSSARVTPNDGARGVNPLACRYCGLQNQIGPCLFSPTGVHEPILGSPDKCVYCGLNDYGNTCSFSPGYYPNKLGPHKHGHDGLRCIYCGLPHAYGRSCNFGPNNYHSL